MSTKSTKSKGDWVFVPATNNQRCGYRCLRCTLFWIDKTSLEGLKCYCDGGK